jgi:MFS family permease
VRDLRRAAVGTAVVFAVSGLLLGTWVSRLPATRDRLHATPAELGLVLLAPGLGSLAMMPWTGRLCRRFGSRTVVAACSSVSCAALFALAVVPSLGTLGVALFCFGLVYGAWDVAMNVQGSTVEQRAGRAWMPRYHACWSAGGILGAAAGGLAARAHVPLTVHFGLVAILGFLLVLAALTTYVPDVVPAPDRSRGRLFTRRLAIVGLITLLGVTVEGAAADWLALYLVDVRHTAASVAATGYAVFALAMAAGRFAGTPVTERLGRDGVARAGGLVLAGGVALAVLAPALPLAFAGTVLWALGVCLIFPTAMSAAGEIPDHSAGAIAAVATAGYGGFLLGPPAIGLLAEQVGLGRALLILPALGVAIAVLAPAVRSSPRGLLSTRDRS